MSVLTKIGGIETTTAIWEFNPLLKENRVLDGSLDVVCAIRTLAVKVSKHKLFSSFSLIY
jgi:hypothetical protein